MVAPFRDQTGYSHAAIEYALALDTAGVEVACRPLKLNDVDGEVPPRIAELERRKFREYDAVIQHSLPHHFSYDGRYPRNIGLFFCETSHFRSTNWPEKLNTMDEVWACCLHNVEACIASDVTVPIRLVPIPCDVSKYARHYEPLRIRKELGDNFIFYFIGEFVRRKNIAALVKAFHLEFDVNEPVTLLLKTTPKSGQDEYTTRQNLVRFCEEIRAGLKLYTNVAQYKQEVVLVGRYSDEEMMRLHCSCDCGVFPAYAEAWSIPAFDCMALGKTPIVTGAGGFLQYMNDDCGWLVESHREPVFGTQLDTFTNLNTAREHWDAIEIDDLRAAMREAYEDRDLRRKKALAGADRAYDFSYDKVGKTMKERLQ